MKVGSKIFNLGIIQKQLAKQLMPLQQDSQKESTQEETEIL